MNKVLRWLAAAAGYLLYTALVLVLLLWALLPAASIRLWLQAQLNAASPALRWEIKELRPALPGGLVATGVSLREAKNGGEELLQVSELRVLPDLAALLFFRRELPFRYQLQALGGILRGKGALLEDRRKLRCEGEATNFKLDQMKTLWARLGRAATGKLSGHYRFEGVWRAPDQGILTAELRVAEGSFALQQPVFGLEKLEFSQLTGSLELKDRALALTKGKVESRLLAGEYSGSVTLADPLAMSTVKIEGTVVPRSELLSGLHDQAAVNMIKKQLKDNKLFFVLSGTVLAPGIQFRGAAGVIDTIMQGGGRKQ